MKTIQWDQGVLEPERNGEPNRAVYQGLGSHYLTGQVEVFVGGQHAER